MKSTYKVRKMQILKAVQENGSLRQAELAKIIGVTPAMFTVSRKKATSVNRAVSELEAEKLIIVRREPYCVKFISCEITNEEVQEKELSGVEEATSIFLQVLKNEFAEEHKVEVEQLKEEIRILNERIRSQKEAINGYVKIIHGKPKPIKSRLVTLLNI